MAGKSRGLILIVPDTMNKPEKPQFSFKDLDLEQLTKALSENQNSVIKIGLLLGSLLLAWVMFNDHRTKDQALHAKISQEEQKLDAIKVHDVALGNLNNFKSSLPKKINEFELIALVSNYAKSYHIAIPSLSPAESKDMGLYDAINLKFNAEADNFKDMMFFLRKIEKSEFPLRLNSWSGHEEDNGNISFDIDITAVLIHT
jgi:hypothetical protein